MKKLFFLALSFIFFSASVASAPQFSLLVDRYPGATYSFYVAGKVYPSPLEGYYVVDNAGLGSIVVCPAGFSKRVKQSLKNIVGESFSFKGDFSQVGLLLKLYMATIIKQEKISEDIYTVYASTKQISKGILLDNNLINLQIAYSKGVVTIGTPIILGDY